MDKTINEKWQLDICCFVECAWIFGYTNYVVGSPTKHWTPPDGSKSTAFSAKTKFTFRNLWHLKCGWYGLNCFQCGVVCTFVCMDIYMCVCMCVPHLECGEKSFLHENSSSEILLESIKYWWLLLFPILLVENVEYLRCVVVFGMRVIDLLHSIRRSDSIFFVEPNSTCAIYSIFRYVRNLNESLSCAISTNKFEKNVSFMNN